MEEKQEQIEIDKDAVRIEAVRNFLCSYQLSADMLHLKHYERKRAYRFDEEFDCVFPTLSLRRTRRDLSTSTTRTISLSICITATS